MTSVSSPPIYHHPQLKTNGGTRAGRGHIRPRTFHGCGARAATSVGTVSLIGMHYIYADMFIDHVMVHSNRAFRRTSAAEILKPHVICTEVLDLWLDTIERSHMQYWH